MWFVPLLYRTFFISSNARNTVRGEYRDSTVKVLWKKVTTACVL